MSPRMDNAGGAVKKRASKTPAKAGAQSVSALPSLVHVPSGYAEWLAAVKTRISEARRRAVVAVNVELVRIYWELGRDILAKQETLGWGAKVIEKLAHDLRIAFPEMRGFSRANLMYMRAFAEAWPDAEIVQQLVGQLSWGANLVLLTRAKGTDERSYYARQALKFGWSRNVLLHHIESGDYERRGRATTNFQSRLPAPQATLAADSFKDPYRFDFLGVGAEAQERDVENALVTHISRFLLELGAGFAFVGRQVHLEVGGEDFYIDLLFYHLHLRSYVVIELKAGEFKPEHAGKLNFYLSAVDSQVRGEHDNPTIGLLLCKTQNRVIAEYALRDANKPMGIAEYQLVHALPAQLETSLPSIEQLEQELKEPPRTRHKARDESDNERPNARERALKRKGRQP
jgi:predicted nuclease of restriction endonuclease-like (RecB) superfamily